MRRTARATSIQICALAVIACLSIVAAGTTQAEPRLGGQGPETNAPDLPAEAKAAIRRVHEFHRRPTPDRQTRDERRLHGLERATRRIRVLLLDAATRDEPAASEEALSTVRAEWAKWKQLRGERHASAKPTARGRRTDRQDRVGAQLDALAQTIEREVKTAEVAATGKSGEERRLARDQIRKRLMHRPSKHAERFPPSMLGVIVTLEETDDIGRGASASARPAMTVAAAEGPPEVAEEQPLIRWPDFKKLLAEAKASNAQADPANDKPERSFLSPATLRRGLHGLKPVRDIADDTLEDAP